MKTFDDAQSKKCPIARSFALNFSPFVPYCDDCYVVNTGESTTCEEAILHDGQRLLDMIDRLELK